MWKISNAVKNNGENNGVKFYWKAHTGTSFFWVLHGLLSLLVLELLALDPLSTN